jgi:hypothetical protein
MIHNFNIICIDLAELSPEDYRQALTDYNVSFTQEDVNILDECLYNGHEKIYLDGTTFKVVGYRSGDTGETVFTNGFMENLKWMPSIKPIVKVILDTDIILEKIKKSGMDSLQPEEKAYLKEQSSTI